MEQRKWVTLPELKIGAFTHPKDKPMPEYCLVKGLPDEANWHLTLSPEVVEIMGVAKNFPLRVTIHKQIRFLRIEVISHSRAVNWIRYDDDNNLEVLEQNQEYTLSTIASLDENMNLVLPKSYWHWLGVEPGHRLWQFMWSDNTQEIRLYAKKSTCREKQRSATEGEEDNSTFSAQRNFDQCIGRIQQKDFALQLPKAIPIGLGLDPAKHPWVEFQYDKNTSEHEIFVSPLSTEGAKHLANCPMEHAWKARGNLLRGIARFNTNSTLVFPFQMVDQLGFNMGDTFDYSYNDSLATLKICYQPTIDVFCELPNIEDICGII